MAYTPPDDELEPEDCPACSGPNRPAMCMSCGAHFAPYMDDDYDDARDEDNEPVGSCEECGTNLYPDDEWDGLCNQCYWLSSQDGEV